MLTGLQPLVSGSTKMLILGSFPGVVSLAAQQYYGHPQNQFWKILQAIWPSFAIATGASSYEIRSERLLMQGLGLWDVYATCKREGSLDSQIRAPMLNDFAQLQRSCPQLQAIAHNGAESFKQVARVSAVLHEADRSELNDLTRPEIKFYKLPSTSPAHAAWSFERKLDAWREVFEMHGLV